MKTTIVKESGTCGSPSGMERLLSILPRTVSVCCRLNWHENLATNYCAWLMFLIGKCHVKIGGELLTRIAGVLGDLCQCAIAVDDPHVIEIRYPASFPDRYLRPELRLEMGP